MGYYINPTDGRSKERWLMDEGKTAPGTPRWGDVPGSHLVCLVDNGWMTAAGIVFSPQELEAFMQPGDDRPKIWFWVPDEKLSPFCNRLEP
jgi:hypothetical protein